MREYEAIRTRARRSAATAAPAIDAFTLFVRELTGAMLTRDTAALDALLEDALAQRLPADVREEAQLFRALPESSLRAPMRALLLEQRLLHLAHEGESFADPAQRELFES